MDRRRLYLVDDDEQVRRALGRFFSRVGFEVRAFDSGAGFLAAIDALDQGCVLLDLNLPDGSGIEVLRELRARGSDLPVILLTGYGDQAALEEARALGACQFLEKPQDPQHLLECVRTSLLMPGEAIGL